MKRIAVAAALALLLCIPLGSEHEYPHQPIHIIVPFAPGTSGDTVTRLVALELRATLHQPVVVDNRSGATGRVGMGLLARARADGYTIGMGNESTHVTLPLLKDHVAYDPVRDFTPLTLAARMTMVIAVNPAVLPVTTLPELLALAQTQTIAFGTPGDGSPQHLMGRLLAQRSAGRFMHVPQPGAAATANEAAEGRLPMAITTLPAALAHRDRLRILAIGDGRRSPALPDVPTLSETWPDFVVTGWLAYFAPAELPSPVAARLTQALQAALRKPRLVAALHGQALDPEGGSADELRDLVRSGLDTWRPFVQRAASQD